MLRAHRIVAVAVLLSVGTARAETQKEAEALVHMKRGIAQFQANELPAAMISFDQARTLAPHKPAPYLWLARAEARRGRCGAVADDVAAFLQRVAVDDSRREEATRLRDECKPAPRAVETELKPLLPATTNDIKPLPFPANVEDPSPPAAASRPTRRSPWLWVGVGTAAAVVIAGVTVGTVLGLDSRYPTPTLTIEGN